MVDIYVSDNETETHNPHEKRIINDIFNICFFTSKYKKEGVSKIIFQKYHLQKFPLRRTHCSPYFCIGEAGRAIARHEDQRGERLTSPSNKRVRDIRVLFKIFNYF